METLTTVVSRISMKVASITETVITQGLMEGVLAGSSMPLLQGVSS